MIQYSGIFPPFFVARYFVLSTFSNHSLKVRFSSNFINLNPLEYLSSPFDFPLPSNNSDSTIEGLQAFP